MTVIKNGEISSNIWIHLGDQDTRAGHESFTVSLARWLAEKDSLAQSENPVGVRLVSTDDPSALAGDLAKLPLIVLEMNAFTDGRTFSQARLLRDRMGYSGEIRVCGDFLRDQMFFLQRVGVDAFEFPESIDPADRLKAFQEFSVTYQSSADNPAPLYRRRS